MLPKVFCEPGNRLIRDGEQLIEHDTEIALQRFLVIGFEFLLRTREFCTQGIVNEVQRQLVNASERQGPGDLAKLIGTGATWEVN